MLNAIPRLLYFQKKNVFTGEHEGMRMRVKMVVPEDGEKYLQAWVWPEPLCFEAYNRLQQQSENADAEPEQFTEQFPLSEEGHGAVCEWVRQQYAQHENIWRAHYQKMKE